MLAEISSASFLIYKMILGRVGQYREACSATISRLPTLWSEAAATPCLSLPRITRRQTHAALSDFRRPSACNAPSGVSSCLKYTKTSPFLTSSATLVVTALWAFAE